MTKRLDMVTAVTRLLLDDSTFSEAVTLRPMGAGLAGELADWVIVDIDRGGQLPPPVSGGVAQRRDQAAQAGRRGRGPCASVDPDPESGPWQVHSTGESVLLAHADEPW